LQFFYISRFLFLSSKNLTLIFLTLCDNSVMINLEKFRLVYYKRNLHDDRSILFFVPGSRDPCNSSKKLFTLRFMNLPTIKAYTNQQSLNVRFGIGLPTALYSLLMDATNSSILALLDTLFTGDCCQLFSTPNGWIWILSTARTLISDYYILLNTPYCTAQWYQLSILQIVPDS
jgi:hypothetical protein